MALNMNATIQSTIIGSALTFGIKLQADIYYSRMTESEAIREKRKFAIELKQLVHQKCVEINHYVSGCDSPFSYTQIADVQESLREIENTLNIKTKE